MKNSMLDTHINFWTSVFEKNNAAIAWWTPTPFPCCRRIVCEAKVHRAYGALLA
jgi:hypothetical protein